jgi:hypothetical protein
MPSGYRIPLLPASTLHLPTSPNLSQQLANFWSQLPSLYASVKSMQLIHSSSSQRYTGSAGGRHPIGDRDLPSTRYPDSRVLPQRVTGSSRVPRQPRQRADACQLDSPPKLRGAARVSQESSSHRGFGLTLTLGRPFRRKRQTVLADCFAARERNRRPGECYPEKSLK